MLKSIFNQSAFESLFFITRNLKTLNKYHNILLIVPHIIALYSCLRLNPSENLKAGSSIAVFSVLDKDLTVGNVVYEIYKGNDAGLYENKGFCFIIKRTIK